LAKEYKSNFLTRTITGLIITAPLAGIVILENYWVLTSFISIVSLAGYYEWVKNGFRHPILWGFNLIFIYFCLSICLMAWILSFPSTLFEGVYELYEISSVSFYNLIILIILIQLCLIFLLILLVQILVKGIFLQLLVQTKL